MAKSNKPMVWGPFAAGGTITALIVPVLILLTLLAAVGHAPSGLSYETMQRFAANALGKLVIFGVVALSLWSSAHRLRITAHDFGARCDSVVAVIVYVAAAAGTIATAIVLLRI